jgi:hypothetical protein
MRRSKETEIILHKRINILFFPRKIFKGGIHNNITERFEVLLWERICLPPTKL